jgi:hypothetical protein
VTVARVAQSVVYGFVNCKTYFLVLLLHLSGTRARINVAVWLLDAVLGVSPRVSRAFSRWALHWAAMFYTQHRIAHVPHVYQQGHKPHHDLQDAVAFDAHLYGSGCFEEWATLTYELGVGMLLGWYPPSLSPFVLWTSWTNKVGHTRKDSDSEGRNMHVDHHARHNRNFGIFYRECCRTSWQPLSHHRCCAAFSFVVQASRGCGCEIVGLGSRSRASCHRHCC